MFAAENAGYFGNTKGIIHVDTLLNYLTLAQGMVRDQGVCIADQDRLAPHGVSSLLQRLHVMDATSAPLDEIEEGITQLLCCFPETEE